MTSGKEDVNDVNSPVQTQESEMGDAELQVDTNRGEVRRIKYECSRFFYAAKPLQLDKSSKSTHRFINDKKLECLPDNLAEVYHRAIDIMFCDKTLSTVAMSKAITMYLRYIDELYRMIEQSVDLTKVDKSQLEKIRRKYKKYKQDTGAEIKGVHYISRDEPVHSIYENADFSPKVIKDSIREGEFKT